MASEAKAESKEWSPTSWKAFPVKQQAKYPDKGALDEALKTVETLPPLVVPEEVMAVRKQLAEVARGERFLLQGGDCAERFADCARDPIEKKLRILLQMSLVLTWGARMPTLRIGRMAGQFSKPRSKDTEVVDGKTVFSFRGDNINSFDVERRIPDPSRLVQGYFHSAATLNYSRALLATEFAGLKSSEKWELGFIRDEASRAQYKDMADSILSALEFMEVCGVNEDSALKSVELFTSHEGLTLDYETALTRPYGKEYFNVGSHFLWIGDRTRQLDGAHVEYFRGIANPIGIKVGPTMKPHELVDLIKKLWPDPEASPGKIVLISRFGATKVKDMLPPLIKAVRDAKLPVVWTCDPMHGNTQTVKHDGKNIKTREFDDVMNELQATFDCHETEGTSLGGVHFELTGENVTECTGGPERLRISDLPRRYTSYCDPRLNYAQSMEVAFQVAQRLAKQRLKGKVAVRRSSVGSLSLPPPILAASPTLVPTRVHDLEDKDESSAKRTRKA